MKATGEQLAGSLCRRCIEHSRGLSRDLLLNAIIDVQINYQCWLLSLDAVSYLLSADAGRTGDCT